jgi:cobalt-precorrin 5A hydrolase / precorrin-3B C17-methyltransferase
MGMRPVVVTFADTGVATAERIAAVLSGELILDAANSLSRLFVEGRPIIGVCAAGILIRKLAPLLSDKLAEPPVLAVSQDGSQIVPLLGGHRGANRLARELAEAIGGTAMLTTASEARFTRALDDPPSGYELENPEAAKSAMAALLRGESIHLSGDIPWLAEAGYPLDPQGKVHIIASETASVEGLVYRPKVLVAGVGCERGIAAAEMIALIESTLAEAHLSTLSLAAIATLDIKADEAALHAAARHFNIPLRLFTADELRNQQAPNPSPIVEAETGTPSVSEAAALMAGPLIVDKRKSKHATCAISRAPAPLDAHAFGRAPGRLHIVGIGPGDPPSRTADAVAALEATTDWVGYGLYLDLIADLNHGQHEHRFPLGDEELRVRRALELAGEGKSVALVSSGDAQIYAMGALAYELLDAEGERALTPSARRVAVELHPGISAFQAASAHAGALLGHDFCCISLSDLLTPREDILKRLHGAAQADFVTALYNPRSGRRVDLLDEAREIFRAERPADTPVIIASNLGRDGERVEVTTLAEFDTSIVDMLTIVLIGSSTSRAFKRGDGRTVAYTPRGYARKAVPA